MKRHSSIVLIPTLGLLLTCGLTTRAASLLLDFGATATASAYATNSPAHAVEAVPATEVTWNQIVGDTNTLYYSDGSAATGVTLDLGRSADGVDTIDFTDNGFSVSALGGSASTGVYAGSSPVKDGIFGGSVAGNFALGMRVDGLPAGTYTLYLHGRNTSAALSPERFYAASLASGQTFSFSAGNLNTLLLNSAPAITNGFVAGDNFGTLAVTIGAGESLYLVSEGPGAPEYRGFMNTVEICPGTPELPLKVIAQPVNRTVLDGANAAFTAGVSGSGSLYMQWRLNGIDLVEGPGITGVNSNILTLKQVPAAMTGSTNLYSLFVTNATSQALSSNVTVTLTAVANTAKAENIWTLGPGDRSYLGSVSTERGLAFNALTTNLLLVSRSPEERVVVLDALTGAEKHFLNVAGIPASLPGGSTLGLGMNTLSVNVIGVADDGAVYVAGLTPTASSSPLSIYRWADDSAGSSPVTAFSGDPGGSVQANMRWGDSIAVRGAGADTQILLAPGTGIRVTLLRTTSGTNFQTEIPPAVITVSGVTSAFGQYGIAFGPGTNTFWAKTGSGLLYLVEYNLDTLTGTVLKSYPATKVPAAFRGIGVNKEQTLLAGVAVESAGDNMRLYDIADLVDGPAMCDQEPFQTQVPNYLATAAVAFGAGHLFALDSNNGIQAFRINENYTSPVSIVSNPTNRTVLAGASVSFTSISTGTPRSMQWRFGGADLAEDGNTVGTASSMLTLHNVTAGQAGGYSLFVSNASSAASSTEATLTVLPVPNTAQMSNIWTLLPLSRTYLGTGSTERGMAYNPMTTNLLLVSRNPSERVIVLDAATGIEKHSLDVTGVGGTSAGVVLGLNTIGVADDGVVYAANLAVNAANTAFNIYRWPDDSAGVAPTFVFAGDPGSGVQTGLRWCDVMAVRGAGADTQILLAPGSGTNVALLRTISGQNFQTEIPPAIIAVKGVPSTFAQYGIAFGPGTNTFWAKTGGGALYLIEFDLSANTGKVLRTYSTSVTGSSLRGIATDRSQKFLAGINVETSDTVRLFDISDLDAGPIQRDLEVFASLYAQSSIGLAAFGGNYLFALDGNNGLKAFLLDANYVPPQPDFGISGPVPSGTSMVLSWPSTVGVIYQVQYRDSMTSGDWVNAGGAIIATGSTLSYTNSNVSAATRFYRVRAQ